MKTRFFALLLSAIIISLSLASCGGEPTELLVSDTQPETESSTEGSTSNSETPNKENDNANESTSDKDGFGGIIGIIRSGDNVDVKLSNINFKDVTIQEQAGAMKSVG